MLKKNLIKIKISVIQEFLLINISYAYLLQLFEIKYTYLHAFYEHTFNLYFQKLFSFFYNYLYERKLRSFYLFILLSFYPKTFSYDLISEKLWLGTPKFSVKKIILFKFKYFAYIVRHKWVLFNAKRLIEAICTLYVYLVKFMTMLIVKQLKCLHFCKLQKDKLIC